MKSPKPATDNRFKNYIKSYLWNRTMLNLCGIVAVILKMATGRNCSMSGIISGHRNLPTYEMSLKSDNVEFVRYCGGHFEMATSRNFSMKMAETIPHKFNIVRFQRYLLIYFLNRLSVAGLGDFIIIRL
jgi:hypothetical protein